jgi:hypothetical protein
MEPGVVENQEKGWRLHDAALGESAAAAAVAISITRPGAAIEVSTRVRGIQTHKVTVILLMMKRMIRPLRTEDAVALHDRPILPEVFVEVNVWQSEFSGGHFCESEN